MKLQMLDSDTCPLKHCSPIPRLYNVIPPFRSHNLHRTGRMETQSGIHTPSKAVLNSPKKDQVRSHQFPSGRLSPVIQLNRPDNDSANAMPPLASSRADMYRKCDILHTLLASRPRRLRTDSRTESRTESWTDSRKFRMQPQSTVTRGMQCIVGRARGSCTVHYSVS